jgi:hypothetical protein
MPTVIQVRRNTAAGWTSAGTTLAAGEIGYETDTGNFKVGDGTSGWTALQYQFPYATGTKASALSATLSVDNANDRVGIGTTTPAQKLDVVGTAAISGATTIGSTLAVTSDTTLTGDLAVNGGDITTTSTGTAAVFNTNATTLNIGGAATAVSIGNASGTTTINNANTAITGSLALATNKLTVAAATGNTAIAGTLGVASDLAVATNKFTVAAATGNTVVAGTLGVTGNVAVNTNKFNITAASGNTTVAGTLDVTGKLTYPYPQVVMNNVITATQYSSPSINTTDGTQTKAQAGTISLLDTSITPRYTTSKILVTFSFCGELTQLDFDPETGENSMFLIYRVVGGTETELTTSAQVGTRQYGFKSAGYDTNENNTPINYNFVYLDSPSTTSAVTYRLKFWDARGQNANRLIFNLNAGYRDMEGDASARNFERTTSQVILQEYFA